MGSWLETFQIVAVVFSDLEGFIAGKAVPASVRVGNRMLESSTVLLPSGPVAPYQVISGGWFSIAEVVFADVASFIGSVPLQVAVKIGNSWWGITLHLV